MFEKLFFLQPSLRRSLLTAASLVFLLLAASAQAVNLSEHPRLQAVADAMIDGGYYTADELDAIFAEAEFKQSVLDAMTSPAEYKFTWGKYRKLFMQPDRIQQGAEFWARHEATLARAEQTYGVPASMIVAIIGVESKFGKYKGAHRVLDSLVTLIIGFDRRAKFFADELKEFLILSKENQLPVTQVMGSYAGAVGFPQFISSSYRNYAVDFSGNGKIDLIDEPEDAIGSIANYFVKNGWLTGQPVASDWHTAVPESVGALASRKRKVQHTAASLRSLGAPVADSVEDSEKLGVLELNASEIVPDDSSRDWYVVRAGDTACQIAERHKVPCRTLFKLNELDSKGKIYRGQKLKLPTAAKAPAKAQQQTGVAGSKWKLNNHPMVDHAHKPRFFFTHENFYVITRYNQSVLYAMAVNDLSNAIESAWRDAQAAAVNSVQGAQE